MVKNLPGSSGDLRDVGSIPGLGRSPGGGHGYPLQYSCKGNPHGHRSLAGYRPQGRKESHATEQLSMHAHRRYKSIKHLCKGLMHFKKEVKQLNVP